MNQQFIVIFTTTDSKAEADSLAKGMVEQQLAACVHISMQGESVYQWQGKVESSQEFLLKIKTCESKFDEVRTYIEKNHSYDVPECIAVPITQGSKPYLSWLNETLSSHAE